MSDLDPQMVRMRHDELDVEREFPASAVPIHVASGWQVVADEPPGDAKSDAATGDDESADKTPKSSRRAAKNEE
ncbi:MAG TPA: hypothetical protein VF069_05930 [Streptosporangiaceae bacterium]